MSPNRGPIADWMNCLYACGMDNTHLPRPIRFIRRGQAVSITNVPPSRTLLEVLREDLNLCGTKEGCGEGDCGACTVVLAERSGDGLAYRAINSCIKLAHSIDGMALWTVEDLSPLGGPLHPCQQAMVDCHGSQCGFCTPGFVMSLFGMYQNRVRKGQTISRQLALADLSGNLCRCTGYRPILEAAQRMGGFSPVEVDERAVVAQLAALERGQDGVDVGKDLPSAKARVQSAASAYLAPTSLSDLLRARAAHPQAQVVAGCTDVGLWVTKQHRQFAQVLDVTRAAELRRVEHYPHHIAIGAAVSLTDAFAALQAERPQLASFAHRFAGLPVRNAGTLGGNLANGSPIGDAMPLLIALGASVVLMRWAPDGIAHRELALEDYYQGYRKTVLAPDELLVWIKVPRPQRGEVLRAYKVSKRFEDDISAVCLCIHLHIVRGRVAHASIGAGGVAATPVRAWKTQAALLGKRWTAKTVEQACAVLHAEFAPISDMRASASYRSAVLGGLLQRFWLESQGHCAINLESLGAEDLA